MIWSQNQSGGFLVSSERLQVTVSQKCLGLRCNTPVTLPAACRCSFTRLVEFNAALFCWDAALLLFVHTISCGYRTASWVCPIQPLSFKADNKKSVKSETELNLAFKHRCGLKKWLLGVSRYWKWDDLFDLKQLRKVIYNNRKFR